MSDESEDRDFCSGRWEDAAVGLRKAWKAAGNPRRGRTAVACSSLFQHLFILFPSLLLSLLSPHRACFSGLQHPTAPLLTQNGFLALHKHCFLFLHPNPKFLGKGTLGGPVPWGRCLLPAPATLAMGQGWEHLTKEAVWSPSLQHSEWVYQELCRAGDF